MTTESKSNRGLAKFLSGPAGQIVLQLLTPILLAVLSGILVFSKSTVYNFIASSPPITELKELTGQAVTAASVARSNASEAQATAYTANTNAQIANTQIKQVISTQADMVKTLDEVHTTQRTVVRSLDALTQQMTDMVKQVDRIEARQDARN